MAVTVIIAGTEENYFPVNQIDVQLRRNQKLRSVS